MSDIRRWVEWASLACELFEELQDTSVSELKARLLAKRGSGSGGYEALEDEGSHAD